MNKVFVIKNQHGLYLNKQHEWVSGEDNHQLYRTAFKDEAINTVFEVSAKDIYLRATAVACPVDAKNQPRVDPAAQAELAIDDTADDAGLDADSDIDADADADADADGGDSGEPATAADFAAEDGVTADAAPTETPITDSTPTAP